MFDECQTNLIMEYNQRFRISLPIDQDFDEYFEAARDEKESQYKKQQRHWLF